eukprot:m.604281 g.604281  ORF g.604281 m.604281 type:complete len:340 (+) comp22459_c0_seq2:130-1149(+)
MILVRATWLLLLSAVCGVAAATKSDKVADETSIPNTTALEWVTQTTRGNLNYLLRNLHNKSSGVSSRDLGNGALAALLLDSLTMLHDSNKNVHNGQHTRRYGCDTALLLLQHHGMEFGTSFDAQSLPPIYHGYIDSCFNDTGKAWILEAINRSLPMTKNEATPQEFSYTNMWLMSTVNSILMGEIVGGERGRIAASVGYTMWDQWRDYTAASGVHEFTSPTYTNVQVSALYMGYLYAKRPGATLEFKAALDLIWADTCANYYAGRQVSMYVLLSANVNTADQSKISDTPLRNGSLSVHPDSHSSDFVRRRYYPRDNKVEIGECLCRLSSAVPGSCGCLW